MSRLGKKPITIPGNVKVNVAGRKVSIAGPGGTLEMEHRPEVTVAWNQDEKSVRVSIDEKDLNNPAVRAYWGMTRSILNNMVAGVTTGFSKVLEVNGVGYTAEVQGGKTLALKLGFANVIKVPIPTGVNVSVEKNIVTIKGADKQKVGQFAAEVRSQRKPEPYNAKGVKYLTETIRRKQGKAFGA